MKTRHVIKRFLKLKLQRELLDRGGLGACREMKQSRPGSPPPPPAASRPGCPHAFAIRFLGLLLLAYSFGLGDATAGTWVQVGSMNVARQLHTATLLPDGRALIAGGYFLSSAELYNPGTASWSMTGSLTTNRYQSTATLLPSGKVLIAGGLGYHGFSQR